jgi:uncharacterized protein (TIGR00304 family)
MRMNKYLTLALILAICGIALIGYSVVSGEGSAGIVLFIPVFYGSGLFAFLGFICIMAAIFLGFFGFAAQMGAIGDFESSQQPPSSQPSKPRAQKSIRGGGVVLIGPIPIIFGSDKKTAIVLAVLAIVMIIAVAFLFYL